MSTTWRDVASGEQGDGSYSPVGSLSGPPGRQGGEGGEGGGGLRLTGGDIQVTPQTGLEEPSVSI